MPWLGRNIQLDAKARRGVSTPTNELTDDDISSVTKGDGQGYCHHVGTIKFAYDETDEIVSCVTDRIIM
jgi:hypothetical protein